MTQEYLPDNVLSNPSRGMTEVMINGAIISNDREFITRLVKIIVATCTPYRQLVVAGKKAEAMEVLDETLVVFRRQVLHAKAKVEGRRGLILVNKTELSLYLGQLYGLICNVREYSKNNGPGRDLEIKLTGGAGMSRLLKVKSQLISSLAGFGCNDPADREEIFNECLLVFWQKLVACSIGIVCSHPDEHPSKWTVYNKKFYQSSRLSTFLTGIARNIFLSRLKNVRTTPEPFSGMSDNDAAEEATWTGVAPGENALFFMFMYYRNFVEPRRLRVLISMLQYDCGLEDAEVRRITGLNNARFHNCRLRGNFREWYDRETERIHFYYDKAELYLREREKKLEILNRKIRLIEESLRNNYVAFVPEFYREEFRTTEEFKRFRPVFRNLFWLVSAGKTSSMAGLPDEERLREMMRIYRSGLLGQPAQRTMIYLLYYATEEPGNQIVSLLRSVAGELASDVGEPSPVVELADGLKKELPEDVSGLADWLFSINQVLFRHFFDQSEFKELIQRYEPAQ